MTELLFALLGVVLGGGVVLAWRVSERELRTGPVTPPTLPDGVAAVLSVLRSSALVVDDDDVVLKASAPAVAIGLVRDQRIAVPELAELVAQVRRDGQVRETELVVPRSAGKPPRHVSVRVAPLGSWFVLALVEDRSREHRVEAVRRDFVANVSHELKTPVGALKLLSDTVADAADDPEAVRRFAGRMHVESDRLTRLVQQIIELSRLQDDDPLDSPAAVPLDELVVTTFDELHTDADARGIVLSYPPTGLVLLGHAGQIGLALGNLVANAVKYSEDGSTVQVTARVRDDMVELSVSDMGMGIPPGELDRIFERFYRVDRARPRATGGTGLGLSIVKHVAASHGGEVTVRSVEGEGSTFTLTLPRRPDRGPATRPALSPQQGEART
ncbi:sensor histidine kinase [Nocardioides terrisoli]|uniref:sensor histidine kinase n=1 Tax=Nocardioides terrisoli TaxID=3388267 RepID=UPI00287B8F4A|nr:ATP-binding protein [Nocardioides marmorisolisilvae]